MNYDYSPRLISLRVPAVGAPYLEETGRLVPLKMQVTLKVEPPSTASITINETSPDVPPGQMLRLFTPQGDAGLFWVKSIKTDYLNRNQRVLSCESVYTTLDCMVLFGKWSPAKIHQEASGKTDSPSTVSALETCRFLMMHQETYWRNNDGTTRNMLHWKLDETDFAFGDVLQGWNFNGQTLADCLKNVYSCLDRYEVRITYDGGYGVLHIVEQDKTPTAELRESRNIKSLSVNVDTREMYNRIYPVGKKEKNIKGLSDSSFVDPVNGHIIQHPTSDALYLQDITSISQWGVWEQVESDNSISDQESIKNWAMEQLRRNNEPYITIEVDALELSQHTGVELDKLKPGKRVRIPLPQYGVQFEDRIIQCSFSDLVADPMKCKLTISNDRRKLANILYKTGGGGGGKKKDKEVDCDLNEAAKDASNAQSTANDAKNGKILGHNATYQVITTIEGVRLNVLGYRS